MAYGKVSFQCFFFLDNCHKDWYILASFSFFVFSYCKYSLFFIVFTNNCIYELVYFFCIKTHFLSDIPIGMANFNPCDLHLVVSRIGMATAYGEAYRLVDQCTRQVLYIFIFIFFDNEINS